MAFYSWECLTHLYTCIVFCFSRKKRTLETMRNQSSEDPNNEDTMIVLTPYLKLLLIISGVLYVIIGVIVSILIIYSAIISGLSSFLISAVTVTQMICLMINGIRMILASRESFYGIMAFKNVFVMSLVLGIVGAIAIGINLVIVNSICDECLEHGYFKIMLVSLFFFIFLIIYSIPCLLFMNVKQRELVAPIAMI